MYTESKKKSIAFIYILLLTQNGEMDSILFIVKKKKESTRFIYLIIVVDTESKKKSTRFIY